MTRPDARNIHRQWLDWLRFARGLSVAAVAGQIGVSRQALDNWRRGARNAGPHQWQPLARLLGVSDAAYWAGPSTAVSSVIQVVAVRPAHSSDDLRQLLTDSLKFTGGPQPVLDDGPPKSIRAICPDCKKSLAPTASGAPRKHPCTNEVAVEM